MKFSMILPIHNGEGHMRKMLDSIRAQTFRDYELICICDGCEDRSVEIAKEYTDIVVPVQNYNTGKSRNNGLELAKGEWLLFADDDDWILHEYVFGQLSDMAGSHGEDILMCSFIWKGIGYTRQDEKRHYAAVWNKAWRREFVGDTKFSNHPHADDLDFNTAMMAKNPKIYYWDMPIYYYNYMREGSISERLRRRGII